ncbi:MAG: retroviral-like aspartic protease family protein [Ardenticatenaceae bacterium]|nr:retroviral-like aspartic protease family protein [Ardenticatenaceae bacterium]
MSKNNQRIHCFTSTSNGGLLSRLVTQVLVYQSPFDGSVRLSKDHEFHALWDTGATNSMVTEKVVRDCNLTPIGMTRVATAGGVLEETPTFLVDIFLPNQVIIQNLTVAQGDLRGIELLIGMDIILMGDFAVTNFGGVTSFSFRFPSVERIDFVNEQQSKDRLKKIRAAKPKQSKKGQKRRR